MVSKPIDPKITDTLRSTCLSMLSESKDTGKPYSKTFRSDRYSVVHSAKTTLKGCLNYKAARYVYDSCVLRCDLEPENKYDSEAIKVVDANGETVGHLASGSAYREKVRSSIESGHDVYALVVESNMEDKYGRIHVLFVQEN